MSRLPRISGREVIVALRRAGFEVARIKGSYHFLRHADGRGTVVPVHSGETIGPGLLAAILRTASSNEMNLSRYCSERCFQGSNSDCSRPQFAVLAAPAEPGILRRDAPRQGGEEPPA